MDQHNKDMTQELKFIDVFSGCGGLSLGMSNAGLKGIFAIEKDIMAFETLKYNLMHREGNCFNWPRWLSKEPCSIESILENYGSTLLAMRGSIDIAAGAPPCQGFSMAGQRNQTDPRNYLVNEYINLIGILQPKSLLIENVRGFNINFGGIKGEKTVANKVKSSLEGLGYKVFSGYINAADFGVPQNRIRYIMIGIRKDFSPKFSPFDILQEIRGKFLRFKGLTEKPISVLEAISDLETLATKAILVDHCDRGFKRLNYNPLQTLNSYQKLMRGENCNQPNSLRLAKHRPATVRKFKLIQSICRPGIVLSESEKQKLGIRKQVVSVLDPHKPSRTITTLPDDIIHYSEPRILTVRECARIQSFPDDFYFRGRYTTGGRNRKRECPRYTQVGNAVPPLLSEALARAVTECIL